MLAVKNADGSDAERYAYDKAGNMVKKMILRAGRAVSTKPPQSEDYQTTTFAFDGANQLVSSTTDGVTTKYAYDAAGRLVKEGTKTYRYGYLDKVLSVTDGKGKYTYGYHVDGQLAYAEYGDGKSEDFLWDGLALIQRGGERFINEPHIGGGNPVVSSKGTSYFNDMLGTTVGAKTKGKYSTAALTAFGEDLSSDTKGESSTHSTFSTLNSQFFTGKPHVAGLGHAFLFRNYRAGLGKWQTSDPFGYPDGWNQLAYCGNEVLLSVDIGGAEKFDYAWRVIFGHWLAGSGNELDIFYDSYFTEYMNANAMLNAQIKHWLITYANGYLAGIINMRRHAEIENGYTTGYELLHGSNGEVGDFEIWGGFTTERQGNYLLYHFDITCQWNDIIDPNYAYESDLTLEMFIGMFGFPFSYFSPDDYVIRIRWNKQLTIKVLYE